MEHLTLSCSNLNEAREHVGMLAAADPRLTTVLALRSPGRQRHGASDRRR